MNTDYYNPLGLILDGYIYINNNNALTKLECNQVRNVYFKREKELANNYKLFIAGLVMITVLQLFDNQFSAEYKMAGYLGAVLLLITALKTNNYNYKIIITTKNQDIIKTNIQPEYKKDAKELTSQIKAIIKSNQPLLKAI
ncbi:MAG: hypothetical protein RLZZ469_1842 [Bacteroidota bacterium]|jgi:hypothetical protein